MKMKPYENQKILIYDIETEVQGNRPDPDTDKFKFFGCYSYVTKKYYFLTDKKDIEEVIDKHNYLVGFNTLKYDNQVLYNNGFSNLIVCNEKFGMYKIKFKTNIDLYKIIKDRASIIKTSKGLLKDILMSYSLDYITKQLNLVNEDDGKIKNFDYNILKKDSFTDQDLEYIYRYLQRDLEVTKKLYEWVEDYFEPFKLFLSAEDIRKKAYINSTTASFAYKAICNALDISEEYSDVKSHTRYGGGYVSYPAGEYFSGNIYCLDYSSLYPSIIHQCNIYSPTTEDNQNAWHGDNIFKVEGYYKKDEQGKVEQLLKRWYEDRVIFKKNKDPKEHAIKIVLNTIYGILGNEAFKNLSNIKAAGDVTRLARQWIRLARQVFRDAGYTVIYTDTDSIFIQDIFNNEEKVMKTKNIVIDKIKAHVPFPYKNFDMSIDARISDIWFFPSKNKIMDRETDIEMDSDDKIHKQKNLLKKNYIYLTDDNKIVVKDLGVRKKSTSQIVRDIFWNELVPLIKQHKVVKFERKLLEELVDKYISLDLYLVAKRYDVRNPEDYKLESQLHCQISRMYGPGIHFLIPNYKYGVGKGKKYCSIEDFQKLGLTVRDIDYTALWQELSLFMIDDGFRHVDRRNLRLSDFI